MVEFKSGLRSDAEVLEYLKGVALTELELRPEQVANIRPETIIVEGLQLDSLKQVILLANLEENFGFEMTLEDRQQLLALTTVSDLIQFIQNRVPS